MPTSEIDVAVLIHRRECAYHEVVGQFIGTSSFYSEFRPDYPDVLWDTITEEAWVDKSSLVLDLGCGPGTGTLALAARAGRVVAVDLEADMVREGRRLAEEAGVGGIEWVNLAAEDVDYPDDYVQLIVIASAFHWMDRPLVASKCHSMLTDTGMLALLGNPTPLRQIREGTAIGAAIAEVQDRWFQPDFYALDTEKLERPETVLEQSGFSDVSVSHVQQTQNWSVERLLGFLRSTSSRPDQRLGENFGLFAAEIDHAIRSVEPSGQWTLKAPIEVITGTV